MIYSCLVLWSFLFRIYSISTVNISGKYYRKEADLTYRIELEADYSFFYCKNYDGCIEYSRGKWTVNEDTLLLRSGEPPRIVEQSLMRGQYLSFTKRLLIKKNELLVIEGSERLYKVEKYKKDR
ncbi:hypothetical protein GCM10028773_19900 [Spirosoma koreense]